MKKAPFKLPVYVEEDELVSADHEYICTLQDATEEEIEFIVDALNAMQPTQGIKMNHFIFDICFSMKTDKNLTEITEAEFRKALLDRLNSLQAGELVEAIGLVDVMSE